MLLQKEDLLSIIEAAVDLRNRAQTAIAAGDHFITIGETKIRTATGQLVTAAGLAQNLATQLKNHLQLATGDTAALAKANTLIATPAPEPPKTEPEKSTASNN